MSRTTELALMVPVLGFAVSCASTGSGGAVASASGSPASQSTASATGSAGSAGEPAASTPAPGGPPAKGPKVEGITEYRLANGLKVLLYPDQSKPTVTVNITYFVGSRHEGYGETGMAHLLEHMVFKGTPTHADIWKLLQDRGAQFNGTTWYDRTNYYEELPATPENLEFALKLEADRMVNSRIAGEDLAKEFSVVRNEFEMGENNPAGVLEEKMFAAAFQWHNYGKTTIGSRSDIEKVPVENLREFYRKHYQPDNAMLIVAGKFDEAKRAGTGAAALRERSPGRAGGWSRPGPRNRCRTASARWCCGGPATWRWWRRCTTGWPGPIPTGSPRTPSPTC